MTARLFLAYGLVSYAAFAGAFLYSVGFVADLWVPKTIDSLPAPPMAGAFLTDLGLLALFALQHSVMARPGFKRLWTRLVPPPIERSTYVLLTSAVLALLFWAWEPMPAQVWRVDHPAARAAVYALAAVGWVTVVYATFLIDHFDLFGLRQVWLHAKGQPYTAPPFRETSLYRWVRHPLLLGFLIAFWAAPRMTFGHLVFSVGVTAYVLVAIRLEEADLVREHGEAYESYRARVSALIPLRRPGGRALRTGG